MRRLLLIPLLLAGCDEDAAPPLAPTPTSSHERSEPADAFAGYASAHERKGANKAEWTIIGGFDQFAVPPQPWEGVDDEWTDAERALERVQWYFDEIVAASRLEFADPPRLGPHDEPHAFFNDEQFPFRVATRLSSYEAIRRARNGDSAGATEILVAMSRLCGHETLIEDSVSVLMSSSDFELLFKTVEAISKTERFRFEPLDAAQLLAALDAHDDVDPLRFEPTYLRMINLREARLRSVLDESGAVGVAAYFDTIALRYAHPFQDSPIYWNKRFTGDAFVRPMDPQPVSRLTREQVEQRIDAGRRLSDVVLTAMRSDDAYALGRIVETIDQDESQILAFMLFGAVAMTDATRNRAVEIELMKAMVRERTR